MPDNAFILPQLKGKGKADESKKVLILDSFCLNFTGRRVKINTGYIHGLNHLRF